MYNYDNDLFRYLNLPSELDKDNVINNILYECADLEVIYPNIDVMKNAIETWSSKQLPVWTHLYETTQYEYDPLINYFIKGEDNTTSETESKSELNKSSENTISGNDTKTVDGDLTQTLTNNLVNTLSGTDNVIDNNTKTNDLKTTNHTETNVNDEKTHSVMAFDNGSLTVQSKDADVKSKDENFQDQTVENTGTVTDKNTVETTYGKKSSDTGTSTTVESDDRTRLDEYESKREITSSDKYEDENTKNEKYTRDRKGLTGIYTTQTLIKEERELAQFNIIDYIVKDFKNRFCLLVY